MPYIKSTYDLGCWVEVEKVFSGRYGKRTKPSGRTKPTTEEAARVNERNAIKKLRRKIAMNFTAGDCHMVLTYRGEAPGNAEAADKVRKFLRNLGNWYKKQGEELKYIKVTEYRHKRIHHHVVINIIEGAYRKARELWKGGLYPSTLYEDGGFEDLAAYLVKETRITMKDLETPGKLRYSCSRNLEEPVKRTEVIQAEKWAEIPTPPRGYWIPRDSIVTGVSERTGRGYQYYRMIPVSSISAQEKKSGDYIKPRRRKTCRSG